MSDLFPTGAIPETLSPRLKWMREQGIETAKSELFLICDQGKEWVAYQTGKRTKTESMKGSGDTEDEAIVALAKKLNLKLWNE